MKKKQKKQLVRVIVSALLFLLGTFVPLPAALSLILLLTAYVIAGYDTLWTAVRNIKNGNVFDENFLMAIATIGALALQDYKEAVFVMLFYLVGTIFEEYAVNKSRGSISQLLDIRPDYANLQCGDEIEVVDPYDVSIGDIIIVKPGERVPLDGMIIEGHSELDTSALTGESLPQYIEAGESISSGCINLSGVLKIQVASEFDDSTVAKILDMVENAGSRKAKVEKFITRFSRYYTPIVVIAAVLLAVIPPLLIPGHPFGEWVSRALIFLVISCPCALVISVPLAFFGGIGGASGCGILVKGSNYLEVLSHVDTIIFDKTGTLTSGTFAVTEVRSCGCSGNAPVDDASISSGNTAGKRSAADEKLLELAAYAECYSNHPIAASLKAAYGRKIDESRIGDVEELPGRGICAMIDGQKVHAGNSRLMSELRINEIHQSDSSALVHVVCDGNYLGSVVISDTIKEDSAAAIRELKAAGMKRTVMLTGDRQPVAAHVASEIGLDEYHAELLPADKVELAEKLIASKQSRGSVVFVGDGINDAPVLARADVGVAMGGLGSEAAIEASDIVIMDDQPSKLASIIKIARKTLGIAKQNVVFALAVKFIVLILGALGMANMWLAVFADVGVAVICIVNSMRCLNVRKFI